MNTQEKEILYAGIDIGSTTTKTVVVDARNGQIVHSGYRRHSAQQAASVIECLKELLKKFPEAEFFLALTGSGAKTLSDRLGLPYVQEVVANSIAIRKLYKDVNTAIELGGQDAKVLFFRKDTQSGQLEVADMRMNGSCAGGTGAFLDEVAAILRIPVEELNRTAAQGETVYDISGRCGVYAKTDIQPLLNQGVSKENLALSSLHAVAKQTIGGLAQGLDIRGPVLFEGGPMTFNPTLIQVFAQRLNLSEEEILVPEHPETIVAYGAALSLDSLFAQSRTPVDLNGLLKTMDGLHEAIQVENVGTTPLFFESAEEKEEFLRRHALPEQSFCPSRKKTDGSVQTDGQQVQNARPTNEPVRAYLGIDCGSTTTKFVLINEDENLLDSFYASNAGEPLEVARKALWEMKEKWDAAGTPLSILAVGTTGYGELLMERAFSAEYHVVETVAHARAAAKYVPDATFLLDIGGQDMKAIWLDRGVITNIVVNEACSSGCGSFLENFAATLHIPVEQIAESAFASDSPAALGSRCTVFMNSSIVTAQRSGRQPQDIMAGLCRSIIENVFTKVIRVSNLDSLGDKIVVQGGTFRNDAVLRALEQYLGREVVRAPYPGVMGAIGAAILAKENREKQLALGTEPKRSFIGLDAMQDFSYSQAEDSPCPFCGNHCKRTILHFSNGSFWVTNNRCERGEVIGDPKEASVIAAVKEKQKERERTPNLFKLREWLLFQDYPIFTNPADRNTVVGLPRVLAFWDTMPFWSTFFRSLGFTIRLSAPSSRTMYESGLSAVTSDTVCFPAKLVHGHLRNLAKQKVDRIFLPSIASVPSENASDTSQSMCAVVKGYPLVIRNSDDPQERFGIPFDMPMFHWRTQNDRDSQIAKYMAETFQISEADTKAAIHAGDEAMKSFHTALNDAGRKVMEDVKKEGTYAVVLASRPYQNDALVNHDLPEMFTSRGIPVLTVDSLPEVESVDLGKSTVEIVNNFHARMLSSAILAARSPELEYVQIVSFGCGHDAYLSDEIIRLMREISGKTPLVLKLDESDIQGPLRIRVRSFLETLSLRRERGEKEEVRELPEPYPVKFTTADREKLVLVPNTSHAFSRIMASAFAGQGLRTESLELGREEAIRYGKQYVHNDICFPAQMIIGEALAALKSRKYDTKNVAIGMGKYMGDCRLTHYSRLLRKALDDAGFPEVPILTNDDHDAHQLHPGFKMNLLTSMRIAYALPMIDAMESLLRKIRPYELEAGAADRAFEEGLNALCGGLEKSGIRGAKKGFAKAIELLKAVPYDRSEERPKVLIVSEYLLNFHPGANHDIEAYLKKNGLEIIEASMTDVIQKTYFSRGSQVREYKLDSNLMEKGWYAATDVIFDLAHEATDKIASAHPLYEPPCRLPDLAKGSDPIIYHTFDTGEGILIPGEIIHHAKEGCRAFVILQPFGCLPNHVVGRGVTKRLKSLYPDAQILTLDYDPDISFANIENRLQMLIMNVKQAAEGKNLKRSS